MLFRLCGGKLSSADIIVFIYTNGGSLPSHIQNTIRRVQTVVVSWDPLSQRFRACRREFPAAVDGRRSCSAHHELDMGNVWYANLCPLFKPGIKWTYGSRAERLKFLTNTSKFREPDIESAIAKTCLFVGERSRTRVKCPCQRSNRCSDPEHVFPDNVGNACRVLLPSSKATF